MGQFELELSVEAEAVRLALERSDLKKFRKVRKALAFLQQNPRHPGLHTHDVDDDQGPNGEKVLQSYVENKTPGAWRIWWFYGPDHTIFVKGIGPHPD